VTKRRGILERVYGAAVLIFPRDFRGRFADEMNAFAAERLALARARGTIAACREFASLIQDLLASAAREWSSRAPARAGQVHLPQRPRDSMDILSRDIRFAVRSLWRRPGFTLVAVLTLALGVGANTAIFSVVNAVLVRPLPYPHPDRLMVVWGSQGTQGGQGVVYADYVDWRARNHSFAELGVFRSQSMNVTGGDAPERLIGSFVDAGFLRVIGASTSRGRLFTSAETELPTKAPVALVSYEYWRSHFGADPGVLGKSIVLNGTAFTIVGVTRPNMPMPLGAPDVSVPVGYYPNAHGLERGTRGVLVAGVLKPDVAIDAARKDLATIAKQLADEYPATNAGTGAEVVPLRDALVSGVRERLLIMLGAVFVVLLIACANVANLQLARGAARARELSVRAALGAGRARIAQQLLTENLVLSLAGGAAGLALGAALTKAIVALIGPQLPIDAQEIRIDLAVLLFTLGVSVGTGMLFGLAPAWQASRANLNDMLRSRVRGGGTRTRNTLAVVQLALSLALLSCAGLLTRSLMALQRVDPGFDGSHLLTAQFRLPAVKYDSPEKITVMFDRVAAELRSLPGVEAAALVRASPLSGNGETYPVIIEGKPAMAPGDAPQMQLNSVTPGYFATMRIPVRLGRDVATTDRAGSPPVIVVNQAFANATWPNVSPLGKRLRIGGEEWRTVVGVVGDTKQFTLNETQLLEGYVPHAQRPQVFTSIVARTRGNPLELAKAVREAVWRVDRDQPVWRFRAMDQDVEAVVASSKTMMWLTALFAIVALLVAIVGIYGVLSYTMSQRTQEVGVRVALGADAGRVTAMVVGEGMRLIGTAIIAGTAASLAAARLLRSQLYGVGANDVLTLIVVSLAMAIVAMLACYIPARRASRVDPMAALRAD
jgi:putative ABC transport system permease protein